jgi:penicillin-binding protein 1A
VERKIKEIILADAAGAVVVEGQILELYLNEIFSGQNSYGVAAAAQTYFNKPLTELAPHEAAMLAAMPQAPGKYHPVTAKDRVTSGATMSCARCGRTAISTRRPMSEGQPLRSVQNGDFEAFRDALPPRDYFTDEIRRQLSASSARRNSSRGGLTIRATVDPEMQAAAAALRKGLEQYDRNAGVWRGTGKVLPVEELGSEAAWRAALAKVEVPRDVESWFPAVVLELGESDARIGIEGVLDDEDGHFIPAEDVTWARKRQADGKLGKKAKVAGDLVAVGDVVLVRAVTNDDGTFKRWSLRQIPEVQGAFMAMDVNTGRVLAMQGGFSATRIRSSTAPPRPRASRGPASSPSSMPPLDSGFTPATIVVDAPIEIETPQGLWTPKNASNRFYGPTPLRTGIEQSRNLMTVRIAQEIGMQTVAAYAERFGVYDRMGPFLANALGAQETTLFKMVAAYAMFANGGERVEPTLVDRVQDRFGKHDLPPRQARLRKLHPAATCAGQGVKIDTNRERVMNAITAYQLTSDDGRRGQARLGQPVAPAGSDRGQDRAICCHVSSPVKGVVAITMILSSA